MPIRQMSSVRIEPAASTWQAPPKDFALASAAATDRVAADFAPVVEQWERPFRVVAAGALITGREVFRRFKDAIPSGLRLDPVAMSRLLESGPHAAIGLIATDQTNRGGGTGEVLFFHTWGTMGGLPPSGAEALAYAGPKERIADGPGLWVFIETLLAEHGFKPADLATFAASPNVATAVAAGALDIVQGRQALLSARELAPLQARLLDKLPGWDKAAYASPVARDLWAEAILDGVVRSPLAKLPGLVKLLTPDGDPIEPAGGGE